MAEKFSLLTGDAKYEYRSFHIDVVRHFFEIGELKKMLKTASFFGLNHFHLHLSDDQGYRLESEKFPLLNEISSFRRGDHFGRMRSDEKQGGFYRKDEIRELVRFASELGIEIVPELDMPGHLTAVIAAYPDLSCTGGKVEVAVKEGIYPEILCPGKEENMAFLCSLLDEIMELFPGKYVHIGGDEVPKTRWRSCPHCRQKMKRLGLCTEQEYQGWLENEIAAYLKTKGKKAIRWNDAACGNNLSEEIIIQYWTGDKSGAVARHVKRGGDVILSTMMNCYADYPYGFISEKKFYGLNMEPEELKEALLAQGEAKAGRVIGNECLIWTEYIRSNERLEELAWPRFAAAAAAGYLGKDRPPYREFERALKREYGIFEKNGIKAADIRAINPGFVLKLKQLKRFRDQLDPELIKNYRAAGEEV